MRLFPMLLGSTLVGCGPSYVDVVDDHREQTGTTYQDCGTIRRDNECADSLAEAESCMLEAFDACRAAEAEVDQISVEGDGVPEHWFIEEGSCVITRITDSSEDEFKGDYPDLQRFECTSLAANGDETCPGLILDGCNAVEAY